MILNLNMGGFVASRKDPNYGKFHVKQFVLKVGLKDEFLGFWREKNKSSSVSSGRGLGSWMLIPSGKILQLFLCRNWLDRFFLRRRQTL